MLPSDIRGISRLVIDAVTGVTDVVEAMHVNIAHPPGVPRPSAPRPARGITGLSYRSVRAVTRGVGLALDAGLAGLTPLLRKRASHPRRDALLSALNGVLGDHLEETRSALAIPMRLRLGGRPLEMDRCALAAAIDRPSPRILVLVHGLCRNDLHWNRCGRNPVEALARGLGHTAIYLRYNSGRRISANGRDLAALLERLVREWPVAVESLTLVSHSMGGLVTRSACHSAATQSLRWPALLQQLVFIATPHHGAPLERVGNWVDRILAVSPYTAPLARLGRIRSAGITDLRYGNLIDGDWEGHDRFEGGGDRRQAIPLPPNTRCFAVAGTNGSRAGGLGARVLGDGLVPLHSALGRHREPHRVLDFPASHRWVATGTGHMGLLRSAEVWARIEAWLRQPEPSTP